MLKVNELGGYSYVPNKRGRDGPYKRRGGISC